MHLRLAASMVVLALIAVAPASTLAQQDSVSPEISRGSPPLYPDYAPAYFIWTDQFDVHVRWATRGTARMFSGEVTSDGIITAVRQFGGQSGDLWRPNDNAVIWRATTAGGPEGFAFRIAGSGRWVRFTLMADGRLVSVDRIFIGARGQHPRSNPFTLRYGDEFVVRPGLPFDRWPDLYRGRPYVTAAAGYLVWHDEGGWHVRWSTRGLGREAAGLISTDGRLSEIHSVSFEGRDRVLGDDRLIAWEAAGRGDSDGVDFRAAGRRLSFTLLIGGELAHPAQIYLGASGAHPPRNPFKITR